MTALVPRRCTTYMTGARARATEGLRIAFNETPIPCVTNEPLGATSMTEAVARRSEQCAECSTMLHP
jgi:hypothetical protein